MLGLPALQGALVGHDGARHRRVPGRKALARVAEIVGAGQIVDLVVSQENWPTEDIVSSVGGAEALLQSLGVSLAGSPHHVHACTEGGVLIFTCNPWTCSLRAFPVHFCKVWRACRLCSLCTLACRKFGRNLPARNFVSSVTNSTVTKVQHTSRKK